MIIKNSAECKKCGDVIESTFRHDFIWCKCRTIFVDGGKAYLRRGGDFKYFLDRSEVIDEIGDTIAEYKEAEIGTD